MSIELALYHPEIPHNTGTLMRLCACFNRPLHIIDPCGFSMDDKHLKRTGLDYIDKAIVVRHSSWEHFLHAMTHRRIILGDVHGDKPYTDFSFHQDDVVLMGQESSGVPKSIYDTIKNRVYIPQKQARSLNLALASAIIFSEGLRQTHYFS
jgi:tRNA (cytidine/uridine-2'-O-)-methyltransferase